jgi:hypothetical protein
MNDGKLDGCAVLAVPFARIRSICAQTAIAGSTVKTASWRRYSKCPMCAAIGATVSLAMRKNGGAKATISKHIFNSLGNLEEEHGFKRRTYRFKGRPYFG